MSEESDAGRRAFATFCVDIRPVHPVRPVGKVLAPEGFIQFVEPVSLAQAQIGKIPTIELSQQTPRPCALQAMPEAPKQTSQRVFADWQRNGKY
jgi:hypothetical protein